MLRNNALLLEKKVQKNTVLVRTSLGAHQHTLQSFQNTILSRNVDQTMLKNAFLEKAGKIAAALGAQPPNPVGFRRLGLCSQTSKLLFALNLRAILSTAQIFGIVKITTYI